MKVSEKVEFMPINRLKPDPNQPRKTFDDETVDAMAQTILTQGVIAPIEIDENNMIVTGEIRWRASKKARVPTVPCRRIYDITLDDKLERQLIENLHRKDLDIDERDEKIYELYMSGRYGEPHTGQGEGTITKLAGAIGLSVNRVSDIIEAIEFRKRRPSSVTKKVPTTIIAETRGLPDNTREKLLEKVAKKEVKQPSGQTEIRKAVKVVKEAPEPVKKKFLKGDMVLEKAVEITEVIKDAPKPLKKAVAEEEVEPERAKKAVKLYKQLKEEGVEIEPSRVSLHVEQLKKEARVAKAQEKIVEETAKEVLTGRKEAFDTLMLERGKTFVREVKDVAWKVKGWGIPTMMRVGVKSWKDAHVYFKQIRDHMDFLLRAEPTDKND